MKARPCACAWDDLLDHLVQARRDGRESFMASMRWFEDEGARDAYLDRAPGRDALPYRYWLILDVDAKDPAAGIREGVGLWRHVLEGEHGLVAGVDFLPMLSGGKGTKFAALTLSPLGTDWVQAAGRWYEELAATSTPGLDASMAGKNVARIPGARHLRLDRWQVPFALLAMRERAVHDRERLLLDARALPVAQLVPLTDSPPTVDEIARWLPDPWEPPTPAMERLWTRLQEDWAIAGALAEARRAAARSGLVAGKAIPDLEAQLRKAGIWSRTLGAPGQAPLYRLTTCPSCGEGEGSPWVSPSGWLCCHRATCEAHYSKQHGGGLPPKRWAPAAGVRVQERGGAGKRTGVVRRRREPVEGLTEDEARRRIAEAVCEALDARAPGVMHILRCTPGAGKTHAVVDAIVRRFEEAPFDAVPRTIVAGATRDLAVEIAGRLKARMPWMMEHKVRVLVGRDPDNCERYEHVAAVGERGWLPAAHYCVGCSAREWCRYYENLQAGAKAPIIVTTYEQALALLSGGKGGRVDAVVFDEDPTRALERQVRIDANELLRFEHLAEPALRAVSRLLVEVLRAAAAEEERRERPGGKGAGQRRGRLGAYGRPLHRILEAVGQRLARRGGLRVQDEQGRTLAGWKTVGDLLLDAATAGERVAPGRGFFAGIGGVKDGDVEAIRGWVSRHTLAALDVLARDHRLWEMREQGDFAGHCELRDDALFVRYLERPSRPPDIVLDAYADARIYRAAWRVDVRVVDVHQDMPTAGWLRVPVATSKAAMADRKEGGRAGAAWGAVAGVVDMLDGAGHDPARVLLIVQKDFADEARARFPACDVRWFGGVRGIDAYRDHTAVVAVGEQEARIEDYLALTQAYFGGDPEPISMEPSDDHVRLAADPRVQATIETIREAEIAQAVHRIRPVLRPVADEEGRPPPPRKVVVLVGRIDSHLLPQPVDVPPEALALAGWHARALRAWGATVQTISRELGEWYGARAPSDWQQRTWAPVALDAAAELVGARDARFVAPAWASGTQGVGNEGPRTKVIRVDVGGGAKGTRIVPVETNEGDEGRAAPEARWKGLRMIGGSAENGAGQGAEVLPRAMSQTLATVAEEVDTKRIGAMGGVQVLKDLIYQALAAQNRPKTADSGARASA